MFKKKKNVVSLVVSFFLLPLIAILAFFLLNRGFISTPSKTSDELFIELRSLYAKGSLKEARTKMGSSFDELINLGEGCELVISVLAQTKDFKNLESCSKKCLQKPNHSGIGYEGLAMSSLALNKDKEVLAYLESLLQKGEKQDRLLVALAQLSYEQKNDKKSRQYFKQLIEQSDLCSAWVLRVIQYERLFQDKKFVHEFTMLVSSKKNVPRKAADHLLAHAKRHNLDPSIKALTKNLEERVG